jgi:hypothetical protein
MANIKLVFQGTEQSKTEDHQLITFANTNNEIYLSLDMPDWETSFICLDKSTAVKLVKELKLQISYLQ